MAPFGIIRMTCKNSYLSSTTDQSNLTSFVAQCVTVSGAGLELMASIKNEEEDNDDDKGNGIPIAIACHVLDSCLLICQYIHIYNVCIVSVSFRLLYAALSAPDERAHLFVQSISVLPRPGNL